MANRRKSLYGVLFLFLLFLMIPNVKVDASTKEYGIIIANKAGESTFYDLNGEVGTQKVELQSGKIMIPLKKVCSYIENLSYQFDFATRKAEIINTVTGKRMIFEENKKYAYVYAKGATTGTKVTLSAKSYVSTDSNAMMVHITSLKYILAKKTGYHYYSKNEIKEAGYDSNLKNGIIVYDPYKKVSALPQAETVKYNSDKAISNITTVTIPEGYSVAQIVTLLINKGVCQSSRAIFQAMEQVDLSKYSIFDDRNMKDTICFTLEGYLYPDTYEFYKNSEPADVIDKILINSNKKLLSYQEEAINAGYSLDEILTYASIIEKEAATTIDMAKVSSVLHARIECGMQIKCDATIYYLERYVKNYITVDPQNYIPYYNTYKCKALPAGPICSPSKNAIRAAMNPDPQKYLYFATDNEGTYYYASNDEEYITMKAAIAARNEELSKEELSQDE